MPPPPIQLLPPFLPHSLRRLPPLCPLATTLACEHQAHNPRVSPCEVVGLTPLGPQSVWSRQAVALSWRSLDGTPFASPCARCEVQPLRRGPRARKTSHDIYLPQPVFPAARRL